MREQPICSIIIRAYNEEDHIGRLLTGILEQTLKDVEIIVVDFGLHRCNHFHRGAFPTRVLSISPRQFTFGRSLNIGCRAAQGEFLVFASAHVYPRYPDWLERLLEPFQDETIGLTYGMQRGDGSTRFSENQQFLRMYPEASVNVQKHPLCNNANAAVRRALWEQHPFDETLSGLEDLAWGTWLLSQRYFLAYAAEAMVIHVHNESARQVLKRYEREAIALAAIRPEESFHAWDLVRLTISNIVQDLRSAASEKVFWKVLWSVIWFRTMQYLGTYLGFRHAGPVTDEVIRAFYYPTRPAVKPTGGPRPIPPIDYTGSSQKISAGNKDDHEE